MDLFNSIFNFDTFISQAVLELWITEVRSHTVYSVIGIDIFLTNQNFVKRTVLLIAPLVFSSVVEPVQS